MKYVIIKTEVCGNARVYPFIFPEALTHSEVARWVQRAVEREFNYPGEVYSAGFCLLHTAGGFYVSKHGSESLKIATNEEHGDRDERILNMPRALQNRFME